MTTSARWWIAAAFLCATIAGFCSYKKWNRDSGASREETLTYMPAESRAILYVDVQELRASKFLKELFSWAPRPQIDQDYAEFLRSTGFDYERDLDRLAIAVQKNGPDSTLFAVAEGRFDKNKIAAYAARFGSAEKLDGREIFSVPMSSGSRQIKFAFLRDDRMALTNSPGIAAFLQPIKKNADTGEWQTRFDRLAGSPVFAVVRQDMETGEALARQAPGGWRSPQLSALLDQLQWITIAAKPDASGLRVVSEGECTSEKVARQLSDVLNGVVVLAQGGLNDAKARQQMDPQAREAYLELLKSADVTRIDRGATKSVRIALSVTPKLLALAHAATPAQRPAVKTGASHL